MDTKKYIKLSILIPTIGRVKEVKDLLESICRSKLNFEYEIIIIDQNNSDVLGLIVSDYSKKLPLAHYKVSFKGLSKAKNYGASIALGEFVSFPDDDCKIFTETYIKAFEILERENADMVFGKCIDENGNDSVLNFKKQPYILNKDNMLGGFVEATVVCKKSIFETFKFDENMGAGTFFGAEEGFDWLYRILTQSNIKAVYSPEIKFYHPQVILSKGDLASLNRVFKYKCGTAYLCRKHNFKTKFYKRLFFVLAAVIIYSLLNRGKFKYYMAELLGLKAGYLLYPYPKQSK